MYKAGHLSFLDTFGFVVLRGFLTDSRTQLVKQEALSALATAAYQGASGWKLIPMDGTETPEHRALFHEASLLEMAQAYWGRRVLGARIEASSRTGDLGWHVDISRDEPPLLGINAIFYWEELTGANGALRVLPGSHKGALNRNARKLFQNNETRGSDHSTLPVVVLRVRPGDAVIFSMNLWHASFNGSANRSFTTACYWPLPDSDQERTLLREELQRIRRTFSGHFGYPPDASVCARSEDPNQDNPTWMSELTKLGWF